MTKKEQNELNEKLLEAVWNEEDVAVIRELLEAGADVNVVDRESEKKTPLHIAAGRGSSEVVKALLDAGADVKKKSEEGMTALHCALDLRSMDPPVVNMDVVQMLISAGVDICAKDK